LWGPLQGWEVGEDAFRGEQGSDQLGNARGGFLQWVKLESNPSLLVQDLKDKVSYSLSRDVAGSENDVVGSNLQTSER